jgi:hypothetical protein
VIENREMIQHELPSVGSSNVESQRVCFSADGDKVIVATRYRYVGAQSNVSVYVSECMESGMGQTFPPVNIPMVSRYSEILHIGIGALTSLTRALAMTLGFLQYFMIIAPTTHA